MGGQERACDASSAVVFVVGLVAGTGCIIASKALYEVKSVGISGELEPFEPSVFLALLMFLGMVLALPLYLLQEFIKRVRAANDPELLAKLAAEPPVTCKMVASLFVPAACDVCSVVLLLAGLRVIPASAWSLLRGGCIVFVALMKHFVIKTPLTASMWVGVAIITLAVLLVGLSPMVPNGDSGRRLSEEAPSVLIGLLCTLGGTIMQAIQYGYEELVMSGDAPAPPWLLIGMEGVYGSLLVLTLVYPLAARIPGSDHGAFENVHNTMTQLHNEPVLVYLSAGFCITVFFLNSFSVLVTFMLSSVWHAILDNFRPISIWATQLVIYYVFSNGTHGEAWTNGSYLQLLGLAVMLYGTAVYNGTVRAPGMPAGEDLLSNNDIRSSPAIARSPLLTHPPEMSVGVGGGMVGSPYSKRPELGDPMGRGDPGGLTDRLYVAA